MGATDRRRLSDLPEPFVCCSVIDRRVEDAIRTIRLAALDGADAFEIHLPLLGYPDADTLARIVDSTTRPVYATCRRAPFYALVGVPDDELTALARTDTERVDALVGSLDAGIAAVDFELDTFDPRPAPDLPMDAVLERAVDPATGPAEWTDDPEAVDAQREVVEVVHECGGEVVLSCHPMVHLDPETTLEIGREMAARGADLAKIVGVDPTLHHVLDTLEANLVLDRDLSIPFNAMSMGAPTRIGRLVYPLFGSSWVFCQQTHYPDGFAAWPLVENAREVFRRVDWEPARAAHREFLEERDSDPD